MCPLSHSAQVGTRSSLSASGQPVKPSLSSAAQAQGSRELGNAFKALLNKNIVYGSSLHVLTCYLKHVTAIETEFEKEQVEVAKSLIR